MELMYKAWHYASAIKVRVDNNIQEETVENFAKII